MGGYADETSDDRFRTLTVRRAGIRFLMPDRGIAVIDVARAADTDLSDGQVAQVEAPCDEGMKLHDAGDHQASVDMLAKAKEMIGLN